MSIETRTLFERGLLTVVGTMEQDDDSSPTDQDFEDEAQERDYVTRFNNGEWIFVGMVVSVRWNGVEIGTDSLWGIEHGTVAQGVVANAWELTPAEHPKPNTVMMGSPLSGVVSEALDRAAEWVDSLGMEPNAEGITGALFTARQWAEPITVGPAPLTIES